MDIVNHPERLEKQGNIGKGFIIEVLSICPDMCGKITLDVMTGGIVSYEASFRGGKKKDNKVVRML